MLACLSFVPFVEVVKTSQIQQCHFYRPQTKFAKVMFLHVSVSHSVHRGGGGGIPACLTGLSWGGVSQHALQVYRPTPKGEVEGSGGGVSRPTPGGECIPACTEADPPPPTATAAGCTHPTGMHSCSKYALHQSFTRIG